VSSWSDRQPVLIDDIVSSARTMIEAVRGVQRVGLLPPVCIGVHALFAARAYADLVASGASRVATCDTVPHVSNRISVVQPVACALDDLLEG
jgi:ribose-phosphate pyrophosphokinase